MAKDLTLLGEYLVRYGLTQSQFAEKAKVPAPMVSVWSRRRTALVRRPGRKNAGRIAAVTNGEVPLDYWDELEAAAQRAAKRARRRLAPEPV
jgi:transcriptional regulator with XRE-family HTH domain